jgi:hypothetical protein
MLGGYYTIDNLVIKNVSFNVSRTLCKDPAVEEGTKGGPKMVPTYADVQLELQPASVYTDVKLGRFLNNEGMNSIITALSDANQEIIKKNLAEIKERNKNNK